MTKKGILIQIYELCMTICIIAIVVTAIFLLSNLTKIEPDMGNGGSFLAGLSIAGGLLALVIITPLATIAASIGFIYEDILPNKIYYKYWLPASFTLPALFIIFFLFVKKYQLI